MHVALIQDDSIVAVAHHSKIFPNTSFGPSGPSAEFLEENSAKLVTNAFAYDPATHKLVDCPAYFVNDHVSTQRVEELTEAELTQKTNQKWDRIRNKRNYLLSESDWTQVADAPGDKAAWATYRQALRDLPASGSDPDALTWKKLWRLTASLLALHRLHLLNHLLPLNDHDYSYSSRSYVVP
jgi:hypothetical protein